MNVEDWVQEEFYFSKKHIYGPLIEYETTSIDHDYHEKNTEYMQHQIALGGYRLAHLIEKYFDLDSKITE